MTAYDKKAARLTYIGKMLYKYSHCWGENPSQRMRNWINEYENLRVELSCEGLWKIYCEHNSLDRGHDAYDFLA